MKMRTAIKLDEELISYAQRVSGIKERTALIHEGLRALIQRETARRLARLCGTEPGLRPIPRRKPASA
jgi:Arc/MetJ family transcription regulator